MVIRRTRSLGRHHQCAKWMLRCAFRAECRASWRLEFSRQHFACVTFLRLVDVYVPKSKLCLRVERSEFRAEPKAAHRDLTDAAPFTIGQLEHVLDAKARGRRSFASHRPHVLVFDAISARLELLYSHQHSFEDVERLESRHDDRNSILRGKRRVFGPTHHSAHVPCREKSLHAIVRRFHDRAYRRRNCHMRDEHTEVFDAKLARAPHCHRIRWRRCLEPDSEEDDFTIGVATRQIERIEGGIHDLHVSAARANLLEIAVAAGNAEHVAERSEDHIGTRSEHERLVDLFERSHTHWTAGPVNHLDRTFEKLIQALPDNRVSLATANFHQRPRACCSTLDSLDQRACDRRVAVFAEILHAGAGEECDPREASATSLIHSSSSSWLISRRTSNVRRASASSTFDIAKPTWTIT